MNDSPDEERRSTAFPSAPEDGQHPSGALFFCPDWKATQKRPRTHSATDVLRRIVLPRLLTRPGGFTGSSLNRTSIRKIPYDVRESFLTTLDLEVTLERIMPALDQHGSIRKGHRIGQEDIVLQYRPEPAVRLLVLLDTSLSMGAPQRASAAIIASVLARHSPSGGLAIVVFDSRSKLIIRFGEHLKPLEAAYRVLMTPVGGVTDIAAALDYGLTVIAGSSGKPTQSILITDGERTAGSDPCDLAKKFSRLHVALVGNRNVNLGKDMARIGNGLFRQVESMEAVPQTLLGIMRRLCRN
jgi:Mg-chelatase subunit ChlD